MHTSYGETEINSLLGKVRIFASHLGELEFFAVNSSLHYVIRLSNGSLYMTIDDFQADANRQLTPEILNTIAARFRETGNPYADTENTLPKATAAPQASGSRTWITLAVIVVFLVIGGIAIAELLNTNSTNSYYQHQSENDLTGETYNQETTPEQLPGGNR